jgi:hypothetical protein
MTTNQQTSQTYLTPATPEELAAISKMFTNMERGGKRVIKRLIEIEQRLDEIIKQEKSDDGKG